MVFRVVQPATKIPDLQGISGHGDDCALSFHISAELALDGVTAGDGVRHGGQDASKACGAAGI